ncbi:hypothetical protein FACS1894184_15950 [Clostridia bacterium]|nr:hypothetical protein FACS1894184_15950 [Clostridia bacterium]
MRYKALIAARSGSIRVINKNLRPFFGKLTTSTKNRAIKAHQEPRWYHCQFK